MPAAILKSAVGIPGKSGNAQLVKNAPADVDLLRRMLVANGYGIPEGGKFDAKLGAVIRGAQKKVGIKPHDGVIVPGDKVFKSLTAKFAAVEKEAANLKLLEFKFGGKTHVMTSADYKLAQVKIFKKVEAPTRRLIGQVDSAMGQYQFYLDTATMKEGIAMAMVQASIMTIGRIKFPDSKKMLKALDARDALERSLRCKDIKAYCAAMRTAEADINVFVKEFRGFVQRVDGNGSKIQGTLEVVKGTSFAAVEILAVPVLMKTRGMPPDKAYLASKTAVASIESLATDLGKAIAGQKITVSGSLVRAGSAAAKEFVLGSLGGKIKFQGKLLTRVMGKIGPVVRKAFPFIPKDAAPRFVARYIQGFGEDSLKAILEGLVKYVETAMKTGKTPTKADIEKILDDMVMTAVLGGLSKNIEKFGGNWAVKNQMILRYKLVPIALKKIDSSTVLGAVERTELIDKTVKKLSGEALAMGYKAVFAEATGHESAGALTAKAEKALKSDREITSKIEALVTAEVKAAKK